MRTVLLLSSFLLCLPSPSSAIDRQQKGNLTLEDVEQPSAQLAQKLEFYLGLLDTLRPPAAPDALLQPQMSYDNRGVYAASDEGSEFRQMRYLPLDNPPPASRQDGTLSANIPWDVEAFKLSGDGRYLLYVTNEDGCSRLNLRDVRNGLDLRAPVLPLGKVIGMQFSDSNTQVMLTLETARSAGELWTYDIGAARLLPPLDPADPRAALFVDPLLVRYPTLDTVNGAPRQVPAFVYKPQGPGPFPVLIHIAGGPGSQQRPGFDPFLQFAVKELGMAVVAPNVRGADGYGRTYRQLDNTVHREVAIRDIGALLVWIGQQPDLDRSRVVMMGSGYGGYLGVISVVNFGDRLLGAIDAGGPVNFVTFLQRAGEDQRELLRVEYGDERDTEMQNYLRRVSPGPNALRIQRPLLIAAGPDTEKEQMAAAIRGRGGRVVYLRAADESAPFTTKANRDAYYSAAAGFIEQLLRPAP